MPESTRDNELSNPSGPIDFVSPDTPIDLTNCEREPIHIPGAIQPHGVLLAFRPDTHEVVQVSSTIAPLLGLSVEGALSQPLERILGAIGAEDVQRMFRDDGGRGVGSLRIGDDALARPGTFDATLHLSDASVVVLELEPAEPAGGLTIDQIQGSMRSTFARLEAAESIGSLAQRIAEEMREVTGFDRVWVYRFHPDWHGEIIGESKRPDIETWLGMHYPASDIPTQARELFKKNWVRIIPDLGFIPAPVIPELDPATGAPLDLGGSVLRSVSPIHVQYLQNMGVTASLVISLVHRGTLWGLVSGQHYSGPKRVPYAMRTMCEFIAQALSLQIGATERLEDSEDLLTTQNRQGSLVSQLRESPSIEQALSGRDVTMLDLVPATGGAIVRGEKISRIGDTPSDAQLASLLAWLRSRPSDVVESASLPTDFPPAAEFAAVASGLLAVALSTDGRDYLLWFRREQRQTVKWAGDPRKSVTIAPDGSRRLHPRGSFELWEEEARGTSTPWRHVEVEAARDLRRAVLDQLIRGAEEIARLNAELRVANAQLEEAAVELELQADELIDQRTQRELLLERERRARSDAERANRAKADFLAVMSHELRTPLNAIGGYAQLMSLGVRGETTSAQQSDLERIQINQRHLLGLINSILNFTKLEAGAIQFKIDVVPVQDLLLGLDALIGPQMRAKPLRFSVAVCNRSLTVCGDEEKIRQILLNLLTNALKFTPPGGEVSVSCDPSEDDVRITVRDTGRGIAAESLVSVFDPFVQIDRQITPASEQGVGLGLAISRELARGMGGDLTAESEVGVGSRFLLTLPTGDRKP